MKSGLTKTLALAIVLTAPAVAGAHAGALATEKQHLQETLALRILASQPVQTEIERIEQLYGKDPQGATPSGKATIERGAHSIALAAIELAICEDPVRPVMMWTSHAPHRLFGVDMPRSGYGIDNPDNVYRHMAVDGTSHYEIHGKVKRPGPAQETFIIYGSIPGMGPMTKEGASIVAVLRSDELAITPDGSFTITVDNQPANGRPNHMQSNADAKLLIARDTLSDWSKQNPVALDARRVAGSATPPPAEDKLAERAAQILATIGPFWLDYDNRFVYPKPVNEVSPPRARPGGWGFSSSGHFALADDEALVITLDPLGAAYLGFQLTDPWGVALEYGNRSGSLNQSQLKPNADGTYTYVIAPKDPRVANWLDTGGLGMGMYAIRWQALPAGATAEHAVRDVRVVKLSALKDAVPPGTDFVDAAQRKAQLAERARNYERRLSE